MLEQLVDLGLIDMQNGKVSEEDKVLLLHIYKSKLNNEQPDVKNAYERYKSGDLKYESMVDPSISFNFGNRFDKIIEFMHEATCLSEKIVTENIREARAFDANDEKMQSVKTKMCEKLENLHVLKSLINNQDSFGALCAKFNIPATEEGIETMKTRLNDMYKETEADYISSKLNVLCSAVNHIIKSDIRQKTYENGVAVG